MDAHIELKKIISRKKISTVFQPIICLSDGNIIGYEALSRGPENSILQSPIKLFNAAETYNMNWELELLCRTKALENAHFLEKNKLLFINVDPLILTNCNNKLNQFVFILKSLKLLMLHKLYLIVLRIDLRGFCIGVYV